MLMPLAKVTAGYIPLLDAAPLIVAKELGFAEEQGIDLELVRESSWATVRDKIAVGRLDAAHLLAPLAIAGTIGLPPLPTSIVVPMALGSGRNAITLSSKLAAELERSEKTRGDPKSVGAALKELVDRRGRDAKIRLAVVHPFSAHAYLLSFWLRACGIVPQQDVAIDVVPPSLMVDALRSGRIDGCCVGEPWSTVAQRDGVGRVVLACNDIWKANPDKVLGLHPTFASQHPDRVSGLVRSVFRAAKWCDQISNRDELIEILARPAYLSLASAYIRASLQEDIFQFDHVGARSTFSHGRATYPLSTYGLWFYDQMIRAGQAEHDAKNLTIIRSMYRPDLYLDALTDNLTQSSTTSFDIEDANRVFTFFDGSKFDPTAAFVPVD